MKNLLWLGAVLALMVTYLSAGHWAMLGALVMMIVVHEFGHWFVARIFGFDAPVFSVGFGSAPRLVLGKFWGTEFQITPWLVGGYVKIDPSDDDFRTKSAWKRAAVLVAGVTMNVLTVVVLSFMLFATVGERHVAPDAVLVNQVDTTITIARDAGIQAGDRVVSVDGKAIHNARELAGGLGAHKNGTPAVVVVNRGGSDVTVNVTPNSDGRIGIALAERYAETYQKMSVGEAAVRSVTFTYDAGKQMVTGLGMMLHIVPLPEGLPDGAADVHGVVAIVQIGAAAFNAGIYSFVMMVCFMSMNLAFFNILPIPMLDGGHLLFLGWEKLTGRQLSRETQGRIGSIFFFLLIALMLFGLFNDLFRPVALP